MINKIANKVLYECFCLFSYLCAKYLAVMLKPRQGNKGTRKKILALPYYGKGRSGAQERIADWQPFFEERGIEYYVHWSYENKFYEENLMLTTNSFKQYKFYFKVLLDRVRVALTFHQYDSIWIQRGFMPLFPYKNGLFEKQLKKHGNVIYDFYDADYESNYDLVVDTIKSGDKITVASEFLENFCKQFNPNVFYVPFSFKYNNYPVKEYGNLDEITIGWMGSIDNFKYVKDIAPQLVEIEKKFPQVKFVFVCREKADLGLKRLTYHSFADSDFDFFKHLSEFDIGINPLVKYHDRTKAKVSFKCLEYMSLGIALATSPFGIPKGLTHNENCVVADRLEDWDEKLSALIANKVEIKRLGAEARKLVEENFDYAKNIDGLIKALNKSIYQ